MYRWTALRASAKQFAAPEPARQIEQRAETISGWIRRRRKEVAAAYAELTQQILRIFLPLQYNGRLAPTALAM
jgi:hypothetical protein